MIGSLSCRNALISWDKNVFMGAAIGGEALDTGSQSLEVPLFSFPLSPSLSFVLHCLLASTWVAPFLTQRN